MDQANGPVIPWLAGLWNLWQEGYQGTIQAAQLYAIVPEEGIKRRHHVMFDDRPRCSIEFGRVTVFYLLFVWAAVASWAMQGVEEIGEDTDAEGGGSAAFTIRSSTSLLELL